MNVKFQGILSLRTRAYVDYQIQFQLAFTLVISAVMYYLDYWIIQEIFMLQWSW